MLRRGVELYLRERAVQLREELALGKGPVISALAAARGLDPLALGRVMRAHRAELAGLIADRNEWTGDFLLRLEALEPQ